ncbi:hypothetical protein DPSP01_008041 [Paraphaeosphaeria sporulosa]
MTGWILSKKFKIQSNAPSSDSTTPTIKGPPIKHTLDPRGILNITLYQGADFKEEPQNLSDSSLTSGLTDGHRPFYSHYALLEYDKAQVFINSFGRATNKPRWGVGKGATFSLKVTRAAELTIFIFLGDIRSACRSQHIFLGTATITPFDGATNSGSPWFNVQHGTDQIQVNTKEAYNFSHQFIAPLSFTC